VLQFYHSSFRRVAAVCAPGCCHCQPWWKSTTEMKRLYVIDCFHEGGSHTGYAFRWPPECKSVRPVRLTSIISMYNIHRFMSDGVTLCCLWATNWIFICKMLNYDLSQRHSAWTSDRIHWRRLWDVFIRHSVESVRTKLNAESCFHTEKQSLVQKLATHNSRDNSLAERGLESCFHEVLLFSPVRLPKTVLVGRKHWPHWR
jgi:hypothetical protein